MLSKNKALIELLRWEHGACKSLIQLCVQTGAFQLPAVQKGWGLPQHWEVAPVEELPSGGTQPALMPSCEGPSAAGGTPWVGWVGLGC